MHLQWKVYSVQCTVYTENAAVGDATLNRCKAFFLLYKKIANPMKPYVYYIFTYRLGLGALTFAIFFRSSPFSSSNASLAWRTYHLFFLFRIFSDDFFFFFFLSFFASYAYSGGYFQCGRI